MQRLSLAGCLNVRSTALKSIFRSERFAMVNWLDLSATLLCDEGLLELADDSVLKRLASLSIAGCFNLTANAVRAFLSSSKINKLEFLDLARLKVRGQCLNVLQKMKNLQLKVLCCPALEEEEFGYIALPSLEELRL